MKDSNVPTEYTAVELLAVYPAAQFTVHDSDSAMLVNSLPQMPSACALVTEGMVHVDGSHVKDAKLPSKHADIVKPLKEPLRAISSCE